MDKVNTSPIPVCGKNLSKIIEFVVDKMKNRY